VRRPGRDHQRVVRQLGQPAVRLPHAHRPPAGVNVLDVGQQHPYIGLLADHLPQRGCDQPGRQDPRRDLIQQRLEQMMICPVHQRDLHISIGQRPGGRQPAEPAADHQDPVLSVRHRRTPSRAGHQIRRPPDGPSI
jgi:hypothetical protein